MDETTSETTELVSTQRSRGRPKRPTAQKSVHQLVLNLTQSGEKKNPNKKQKPVSLCESETPVVTTTTTAVTQTTDSNHDWKVGQRVEARDTVGDWYSAKIVAFNDDSSQLLVHFERWSSRYDQWFARDSDQIREKTSSENTGSAQEPEFALHEEVLARWTDNRPYPATIVELNASQRAVLVLFFDGYRKKVKFSQIEKMPKHFSGLRQPLVKSGFEIKADHNDFKCHFDDCRKGFRKQSLLTQHLKHYHKSDDKSDDTTEVTLKTPVVPVVEETESSPVVTTSRLKRKYVRKPLPSVAVRKSNRQSIAQNDFLPVVTTTTPKETVTPNTTLPFWDARTVAEIHETDPEELVNCVCDAREESGLMVQCECCLCWQHAHCMHFDGEVDVPKDGYFCLSCRSPENARKSAKNAFLVNHWLKSGKRAQFQDQDSDERQLLRQTNAALAVALDTREVLWGLQRDLSCDDVSERQNSVWRQLTSLEERTAELEKEVFCAKDDVLSECEIKSEISLMFCDLKNAKILAKD